MNPAQEDSPAYLSIKHIYHCIMSSSTTHHSRPCGLILLLLPTHRVIGSHMPPAKMEQVLLRNETAFKSSQREENKSIFFSSILSGLLIPKYKHSIQVQIALHGSLGWHDLVANPVGKLFLKRSFTDRRFLAGSILLLVNVSTRGGYKIQL